MAEVRFTILGCGSSGGVPRLGDNWGNCDPHNPRNFRRRCSLLIEQRSGEGITRVLVDTSPDLRSQLLDVHVGTLDAVIYTHAHADHVHGIDDLRMVVFNMKRRLPVWADEATQYELLSRFGYAFVQPEGSPYPPILEMNTIKDEFSVTGTGGRIDITPFRVRHGSIHSLGFRVADLAYLPDVQEMTEEAWDAVDSLDCWVLDALRRKPHPSHAHLDRSLGWIERAAPRRAVLTNMHVDMDYAEVTADTPDNVMPAFDGMIIRYEI